MWLKAMLLLNLTNTFWWS